MSQYDATEDYAKILFGSDVSKKKCLAYQHIFSDFADWIMLVSKSHQTVSIEQMAKVIEGAAEKYGRGRRIGEVYLTIGGVLNQTNFSDDVVRHPKETISKLREASHYLFLYTRPKRHSD